MGRTLPRAAPIGSAGRPGPAIRIPPTIGPMGALETLLYEAADGVGTLTINRPDHFNGMTNRMLREAHEVLRSVAADRSVKVLVLTGAGKAFCPGADLKHYTSGGTDEPLTAEIFQVPVLLHEMPQVTIAAINGACAGAGLGWACACDLRFAATTATFNTAFLGVAVAGDMGLPWSLPRLVGAARARELMLFPGKFSAADALSFGLVTRVFDGAAFRDAVGEVAAGLAASAPLALRGLKENLVHAERTGFSDFIAFETERHMHISASADTREAFRAFVEKRPARFEGR